MKNSVKNNEFFVCIIKIFSIFAENLITYREINFKGELPIL